MCLVYSIPCVIVPGGHIFASVVIAALLFEPGCWCCHHDDNSRIMLSVEDNDDNALFISTFPESKNVKMNFKSLPPKKECSVTIHAGK